MSYLIKAALLGAFMVMAASYSNAASPSATAAIDGLCDRPVILARSGELALWRTKLSMAEMTPFAVERDDKLAWLYVQGGNGQLNQSPADFDRYKSLLTTAYLDTIPGIELASDAGTITGTYEGDAFFHGEREAATFGVRHTLIDGCVFSVVMTMAGNGHRSDIIALFDQVRLSN